MIPSTVGFLDQDFEIETQPSLTYKMDLDGDSVRGLVDEQDAMKQMIFRTLQTERYQYIIYPWYYGIETLDLYGEPVTWVCPELERRISEALAIDERITGVTDFEFDLTVKGVVHAYFTVKTIYGDIKAIIGSVVCSTFRPFILLMIHTYSVTIDYSLQRARRLIDNGIFRIISRLNHTVHIIKP